MPCRRPGEERRLLLLERAAVSLQAGGGSSSSSSSSSSSVVGAGEVDALVTKLGEVLQLNAQNRTPAAAAAAASDPRLLLGPKQRSRDRAAPYASPRGLALLASLQQKSESPRGAKQLCGRGWMRRRKHLHQPRLRYPLLPGDEDEDDPHRLLQQLILSGNLIKEAVRRLQLAAAEARSSPPTAASSSASSASSAGSCGCHSSSGEGEAASLPVSALRALP